MLGIHVECVFMSVFISTTTFVVLNYYYKFVATTLHYLYVGIVEMLFIVMANRQPLPTYIRLGTSDNKFHGKGTVVHVPLPTKQGATVLAHAV